MMIRLLALVLVLASVAGSAVLVPAVTASAGRHKLSHTVRAEESDRPEVSLGIAMGAFRGLFVNMLWMRANDMKEAGQFHEAIELARTITKLQPRFPRVWAFHAWNLAYNISVETQTPEERYQWVMAGVRLLRDEGIPANPNDLMLHKELAWILLHKIGGYTDDSNQYYKRELAADWTVVLGEPPRPDPDKRGREDVIELFAQWLTPIDEAPDRIEEVIAQTPAVRDLLAELEDRVGVGADMELLRRWTEHRAIVNSPRRQIIQASFGPKNQAFAELLADERFGEAWDALIPHVRKRIIIDEFHMEPRKMIRYTRKYGPLDWRHHGSHGLYWAAQGVERTLTRFDEYNRKNFDFVNTDRMVMQAIQQLFRSGDIYFNYLAWSDPRTRDSAYFQGLPNPYFIEAYGDLYEEIVERGGVYEDPSRPRRNYAVGYENFLQDAISFFYRRGERARAEAWYAKLRTWKGQNTLGNELDIDRFGTLDEFVAANLFDRYTSPHVASAQTMGSLQGAYQALIRGESELFRGQFDFARQVHAYFFQQQGREVVASQGAGGVRMEWMDRDFRHLAGGVFAATIDNLAFDEAELAYSYAPESLQRYAYDIVVARFKPAVDEAARNGGAEFGELFPEPGGMDAFRQDMEQRRLRLQGSELESINRQ